MPQSIREAALGLGIPKWRTIVSVVLRTASAGIVTSIMLAFARIAGESAPLMFTAFGNEFWNMNPNQPVASLAACKYTNTPSSPMSRRMLRPGLLPWC